MKRSEFSPERFRAGEMPRTRSPRLELLRLEDSGFDCLYPMVAWIKDADGFIHTCPYTANGSICAGWSGSDWDLYHEPKLLHVKVCLYRADTESTSILSTTTSEIGERQYELFVRQMKEEGRFVSEVHVTEQI